MADAANGVRAKIPGVTVSMAGADWIVPPLTLGQMRRLETKIETVRALETSETDRTSAIAEVVAAAMSRNYDDMTPEKLIDDMLDLGNFVAVFNAAMAISGLVQRGEAMPAASEASASTGSTGDSPSV